MSEPQTLASAILISAAPGSGSGTGYSRISNGLPVPWNTAIRALSAIAYLLVGSSGAAGRRALRWYAFSSRRTTHVPFAQARDAGVRQGRAARSLRSDARARRAFRQRRAARAALPRGHADRGLR